MIPHINCTDPPACTAKATCLFACQAAPGTTDNPWNLPQELFDRLVRDAVNKRLSEFPVVGYLYEYLPPMKEEWMELHSHERPAENNHTRNIRELIIKPKG